MRIRFLLLLGLALITVGAIVLVVRDRMVPAEDASPAPQDIADTVGEALEGTAAGPDDVDAFLDEYNDSYQRLWTDAEGATWTANIDISGDNSARRIVAGQALADFVGSQRVIDRLRSFRSRTDLTVLQERQIEVAWQTAAHYPMSVARAVADLLQAEAVQNDSLMAYEFWLTLPQQQPRRVTTNEIDALLISSDDLSERRALWECSKRNGPMLKDGLVRLQGLRNRVARDMGYSSFFALEVADYGLSSAEMIELLDEVVAGIMPLYEQLHCWARHELAERYGVAEVPRQIPAHWLGNRWAQRWPGIVAGIDLDAMFSETTSEWIIEQAERFYVSLGFEDLPATFWERSDLFALPGDAVRKKNTHASAWHIDLDQDVRSLMSVEPDFRWFGTTHHELGHIYYYLSYSRPEVPYILRRGANRAFHEGIGTLIELASTQLPYLEEVGLLTADEAPDEIRWLLSQALVGPVVFLPFACGTMSHWEHDLYEEDLPRHRFNTRWWELARHYQGIAPPGLRGEDHCDPVTKTHISDDPAQYYDYALSEVLLHQLHRYICRELLHQDVHAANYYGSQPVGHYLRSILEVGATRNWRQLVIDATGEDLSSEALLEYYAPLREWLVAQNTGRDVGFR